MVFRERAPELLGSNCLESKCNCEPYKILQGFVQNCYGYKVAELLDSNRSVSVSSLSENFLDGLPETWYHKDVANGIPFIQVKTGAERKALRPFFLLWYHRFVPKSNPFFSNFSTTFWAIISESCSISRYCGSCFLLDNIWEKA